MAISSTTTVYDNEKYLDMELLERSENRLVMAALCDQDVMPQGAGLTAYMVRYVRMSVPLTALTEGTLPTASTFTLEQVTVTLDQWGDYIDITDVAELTTKHPLVQEAMNLLADNAARVMDREVQLVMLAGTNVAYGDGSVTTRATITETMVVGNATLGRQRAALVRAGVPPRGRSSGDSKQVAAQGTFQQGQDYLAVCGPEVIQDIMATSTSFGTFVAVATYNNAGGMYNCEVGKWLGFRWVETNFIPQFKLLGNKTTAVVSANAFGTDTPIVTAVDGGGTLTSSTTYYYKVTRKSLLRGFEEDISIIHSTASTATANNESFTFNFSSLTAGYVYNLYFGASASDAALFIVTSNIAIGTTVTVTAAPVSGTTAPANIRAASDASDPIAVHPIFILGNKALGWTGFYKAKFMKVLGGAQKSDPLDQHRYIGYKFMGKAVIKDQTRLLRLEVASAND